MKRNLFNEIMEGFQSLTKQQKSKEMTEKKQKPKIGISFDLSKVNIDDLFEIERLLLKNGISFDTGAGMGHRDWEWDWSLKGPVKVTVRD